MKLKLIATVVALLVVYEPLIGTRPFAQQVAQQARQSITVNKQGTLLELFDADGTSLTKRIAGDGFTLNYQTRGKWRSASAIGMKTNRLQDSAEPLKLDENTATAIVQTADKSLEITSEYTFNRSAGELFIKRTFKNISEYPVTLQSIWNYVGKRVVVRGEAARNTDLYSTSLNQITAGFFVDEHDCDVAECPIGPVCPKGCPAPNPPNPNPLYQRARLYPSKTEVVLRWSKPITLRPQMTQEAPHAASIVVRVAIK